MCIRDSYKDASIFSFDWFTLCRSALSEFYKECAWHKARSSLFCESSGLVGNISNAIVSIWEQPRTATDAEASDPTLIRLPAAYYLIDDSERAPGSIFNETAFDRFVKSLPPRVNPVLLIADSHDFAFLQSLADRVNPQIPRLRLPPGSRVFVRDLLCADTLIGCQ